MPLTPTGYQRRNSLRHPSHDYTQAGAYFVTICTHRGRPRFGEVTEQGMMLNPVGKIADGMWHRLVERHQHVHNDAFVVMPNHVHLLLWLTNESTHTGQTSDGLNRTFGGSVSGSLSKVISAYKSSVTQQARGAGLMPGSPLWQRNFYDSIVRSEASVQRVRQYIWNNPSRWFTDRLHPKAPPNQFNKTW